MNAATLLLVDDNLLSLKLLSVAFEMEGYHTRTAEDGQKAFEILVKDKIDLIISDILMPNVDGYYLCYKVRSHEKLKAIPILIYTTYTTENEDKIARTMGADRFVRKPAPIAQLAELVKELLSNPSLHANKLLSNKESFERMHQYNAGLISKLEQRNLELEKIKENLEQLVDRRTYELKHANEELQASNEELLAANEELSAMNENLVTAGDMIQKQDEIIIRQKDEQLNRVLDSSQDVIWSVDLTGAGHTYISRSAENITGLTMSQMLNNPTFWMAFVSPDFISLRKECLDNLKTADHADCTYSVINQTGELLWMNEKIRVIKDNKGKPIRREGVISNISSLQRAEEALGRERNLLRSLIDNIPDYIYVKDQNLNHIINNAANVDFLNAESEAETLGRPITDFVGPEGLNFLDDDRYILATGKPMLNKEETINHQKHGNRTLLTTKVPLKDANGNPTGIVGISRDITDRKRAEKELQQNRHILSKAKEVALLGHWLYYPAKNKAEWNKHTLSILGLPETFSGGFDEFLQFVHEQDQEGLRETFYHSIQQRRPYNMEYRLVNNDGVIRWIHERADFITHEHDPELVLIGVFQDVSKQKSIEEIQREFNLRFEILSRATNDAIWDWNVVNNFQVWNHGIETIFGYTERQAISTHEWWQDKLHADDYPRIISEIKEIFEQKKTNWTSEYRYLTADGSYKNVLDRAYVIYEDDKPIRVIGAMQDITEIIQYRADLEKMVAERTRELNEALKKEKELVEMKSKFISIASHEFRTPLSTISLATGFLKKYKSKISESEINSKLESIEQQVYNMTYLLDDVLTVGKMGAGTLKVNLSELEFELIEKMIREVMKTTGATHRLKFFSDCKSTRFTSDLKFLRNIVSNLITNAVKFSPLAKEVEVSVHCDQHHIFITVKDFGIGIPPDDLKNLFTSFYRASNVNNIGGTGLGLSIVQKALDLLNGTITIKSEMGAGTEFKVTLPKHYV